MRFPHDKPPAKQTRFVHHSSPSCCAMLQPSTNIALGTAARRASLGAVRNMTASLGLAAPSAKVASSTSPFKALAPILYGHAQSHASPTIRLQQVIDKYHISHDVVPCDRAKSADDVVIQESGMLLFIPSRRGHLADEIRARLRIEYAHLLEPLELPVFSRSDAGTACTQPSPSRLDVEDEAAVFDGVPDQDGYREVVSSLLEMERVLTTPNHGLHHFSLLPAVRSPGDLHLFSTLAYSTAKLARTKYFGHGEGHSLVYIGSRGCGKTLALQRFALTATVAFPDVRVVYIDARNCNVPSHPLFGGLVPALRQHLFSAEDASAESSLQPLAAQPTAATGTAPVVDTVPRSPVHHTTGAAGIRDLEGVLQDGKIRLVVLLDEMEEVYKHDTCGTRAVLHDVAQMATSSSGRVIVAACGSSSVLSMLVKAVLPASMHNSYPLAAAAVDMNGSKLCERRLPPSLPMDCTRLEPFFPEAPMQVRKLACFHLGTLPRVLHEPRHTAAHAAVEAWGRGSLHESMYCTAYPFAQRYLEAILDRLVERNMHWLSDVAPRGYVDDGRVVAVLSSDKGSGFNRLVPLNDDDVDEAWRATMDGAGDTMRLSHLRFMSDCNYIVLREQPRLAVYPSSCKTLALHLKFQLGKKATLVARSARVREQVADFASKTMRAVVKESAKGAVSSSIGSLA